MQNDVIIAADDSPYRCQRATYGHAQCNQRAMEGYKYCPMHNDAALRAEEKERLRNYNLTKWQSRINDFADNSQIKSLREEVGIARMVLETIIERCQDGTDIELNHQKISTLLTQIDRLVNSCHKLELQTSQLLDKAMIIQLASIITDIIDRNVADKDVVNRIGDEIIASIGGMKIQLT